MEVVWETLDRWVSGAPEAPLFLVHPRGGGLFRYRELVAEISSSHSVYGIQPAGLDELEPCLNRVEDMSSRYVSEIRRMQDAGPVLIGGYSFGGTVDYEMARQFTAAGREVALLALFDIFGPDFWTFPSRARSEMCKLLCRAREFRNRFFRHARGEGMVFVLDRVRSVLWRRGIHILPNLKGELPDSLQRVVDANVQADREHVMSTYEGCVTLFAATSPVFGMSRDPTLGWSRAVTGRLKIRKIEDDHTFLLQEPYVQNLADQWNKVLAEVRSELRGK